MNPEKSPNDKKDSKTLKGMRDIFGDEYYAYQGFYEKAAEIAIYYGFQPIETPVLEEENLFISGVGEGTDIVDKEIYAFKTKGGERIALRPEGTVSIMRAYFENGFQGQPQPVMLYFYGPLFRHDRPQKGRYREFRQFDLEIIGTSKSIADAMIIKLTLLILEEAGLKNLKLDLNSIGDKECRSEYRKELVNYYKKHLKDICPDCRERLKTNPLRLLDCKSPECQPIKSEAPNAISFLCAGCKAHFKELLEYLEMMGVTYEINHNLVRGLDYYSRTVFEITNRDDGPDAGSIAGGGRYDYLARRLGSKKDTPAVGGAIGVDRVLLSAGAVMPHSRLLKKPKVFFIQLSFDAKLKSMQVIEVLRKAKVPIAQSISKDSLAAQLAIAERLKVPYTIILGQREAIENTVIVRNMTNRSQDVVPIKELGEYLKNIK